MARRFNYRRVKIHRAYKIAELADLLGVHKKTVGRWIAAGLRAMGARRSRLVHGEDFHSFMNARKPIKQCGKPGDIWCLGCHDFKRPALNMAEYSPRTILRGMLSAICPDCGRMIYRATTLAKLQQDCGGLDIVYPKAERRLNDTSSAISNVHFERINEHDQTQC
jgi:excisionase family DNA binding protein